MIHASALVDPDAQLAAGCEVGPFSIIGAGVTLGEGCVVGPHVVIKGPTDIGARNRIFQFSSIGEDPQDLKYAGEPTKLIIGDDNVIREYVTLNRGTVGGGGITRIGSHNLFMAYTHVAHDCCIGSSTIFANGASLAGHVTVGDHAILAGFAGVHQFRTIGEHAFVGLHSVANRDVSPYTVAVGNYAEARGINKTGLRRRGFSDEAIAALHRAYMLVLYRRGDRDEAIASLADDAARHTEVKRFLDFIVASEHGVVR